jgi:succinoglycan biosynthesis transport protein ExoP
MLPDTDPNGEPDRTPAALDKSAWVSNEPHSPSTSRPGVWTEGGNGAETQGRRPTAARGLPAPAARSHTAGQKMASGFVVDAGFGQNLGLYQYVRPLLRWWWLILISAVIGAVSGYLGARDMPRHYQARTTIMVGQALLNPNPSSSDFSTGQVLAQSYADLARREPVVRGTLNALGLSWNWTVLQAMVTSRVIPGTSLIEISVLDTDPQRVAVLTNELGNQLILQSPSATDPGNEAQRQFIQSEIDQLQADIQKGRVDIKALDGLIAKSNSAREIQDARDRQTALQMQITTWEATYAQLLTELQKGTSNFLSIVEPAQVPLDPVGPGMRYIILLGLAMGLVFSGGAAYLLEYIDDTLKSDDDVRQRLGLVTLGSLPLLEGTTNSNKLVVADQPRSLAAGAFRVLRTNLQFFAIDRPLKTLMVCSVGPREGKSLVSANLAAAMAQAGQRVILVDTDLWRPTQHRIFGLYNSNGLTNLLLGDGALNEVLQAVSVENLQVLPTGPLPPNPADLLSSRRMQDLMDLLRGQSDIVIFDTPPFLVDADAAILAARADGVLLVIDAGHTRRALARRCQEALGGVGAYVVGVALNRVRGKGRSYSYYYAADEQEPSSPSLRISLPSILKKLKTETRPAEDEIPAKCETAPPLPAPPQAEE